MFKRQLVVMALLSLTSALKFKLDDGDSGVPTSPVLSMLQMMDQSCHDKIERYLQVETS